MTDPDLLAALAPVLRLLRDLGVRHFVGGSVASSAHGVAGSSVDGDVMGVLHGRGNALDLPYLRAGAAELGICSPERLRKRASPGNLERRSVSKLQGAG